ncbi:hypothetical protein NDU88_001997 [Pleurodeles waltl]|uniref:Uncharacterized protein n=1 Tax=Pleurodeles waltl TaxID=8319 RepID=A0AAV7SBZ4_PLEWA|nr:hypothetical protein NDU88_001997 [Pleurodeles waltl]
MILSNLKGEAVVLAVCKRLRDAPQQDQELELPKIIAETYSSIGRDSLGGRPQKLQIQGKITKDSTKQQPEGTKKRWEKKQQTPKKERGESPRTETPQTRTQMFVPDLDGPGVEAAETPFDINDRVTVLQELQQFRQDNSSKRATSTGIKDVPVIPTGWIPRIGDLVREKVAVKK